LQGLRFACMVLLDEVFPSHLDTFWPSDWLAFGVYQTNHVIQDTFVTSYTACFCKKANRRRGGSRVATIDSSCWGMYNLQCMRVLSLGNMILSLIAVRTETTVILFVPYHSYLSDDGCIIPFQQMQTDMPFRQRVHSVVCRGYSFVRERRRTPCCFWVA
jgi:hypothetical protein